MSSCRISAQPLRLAARAIAPAPTLPASNYRAYSTGVAETEAPQSAYAQRRNLQARRNAWIERRNDNGREGRRFNNDERRNERRNGGPRELGTRTGRNQNQRGGVPPNNLAKLLETFATLKKEGRKPTAAAYAMLVREAANYGHRRGTTEETGKFSLGLEIALGAIRDAEAGGIELGVEAFDDLLRFVNIHPEILPSILLEFARRKQSSTSTYNTLAGQAIVSARVEELIMILIEMLEQNMAPNKNVTRQTIRVCCEWGLSKLALDLVKRLEAYPGFGEVQSESWVQILMAAADQQDLPTVEEAWDHVVNVKAYTPDEGLILAVLAVASRWGKPQLATRALAALTDIGVSKKEHHLSPLIEAFCRDGRVPDAIEGIALIRQAGLSPTLQTVRPIVEVLRTAEVIDQAFYCLEDRVKEGKAVDVSVFNALIQASARAGDLQRARATQLAAPDLKVTPNADTFNIVLEACSNARHKELAQVVQSEMEAAGIQPTEETYNAIIRLALSQPEYEDAFYYLEKMKAEGIKPGRQLYKQIGMKCVASDDKRHTLVADEMEAVGYGKPDFAEELRRKRERQANARAREAGGRGGDRNGNNDRRRRRDDNRRQSDDVEAEQPPLQAE